MKPGRILAVVFSIAACRVWLSDPKDEDAGRPTFDAANDIAEPSDSRAKPFCPEFDAAILCDDFENRGQPKSEWGQSIPFDSVITPLADGGKNGSAGIQIRSGTATGFGDAGALLGPALQFGAGELNVLCIQFDFLIDEPPSDLAGILLESKTLTDLVAVMLTSDNSLKIWGPDSGGAPVWETPSLGSGWHRFHLQANGPAVSASIDGREKIWTDPRWTTPRTFLSLGLPLVQGRAAIRIDNVLVTEICTKDGGPP